MRLKCCFSVAFYIYTWYYWDKLHFVYSCPCLILGLWIIWSLFFIIIFIFIEINHIISSIQPHLFLWTFLLKVQPRCVAWLLFVFFVNFSLVLFIKVLLIKTCRSRTFFYCSSLNSVAMVIDFNENILQVTLNKNIVSEQQYEFALGICTVKPTFFYQSLFTLR